MTFNEIIDYMYENHVQGDFKIEEMAEDLSQKTGKWVDSGYGVECSLCGEWYPHASIARNQLNFCPNCGADMRGEARKYLEYGKLIAKGIEQGLRGEEE